MGKIGEYPLPPDATHVALCDNGYTSMVWGTTQTRFSQEALDLSLMPSSDCLLIPRNTQTGKKIEQELVRQNAVELANSAKPYLTDFRHYYETSFLPSGTEPVAWACEVNGELTLGLESDQSKALKASRLVTDPITAHSFYTESACNYYRPNDPEFAMLSGALQMTLDQHFLDWVDYEAMQLAARATPDLQGANAFLISDESTLLKGYTWQCQGESGPVIGWALNEAEARAQAAWRQRVFNQGLGGWRHPEAALGAQKEQNNCSVDKADTLAGMVNLAAYSQMLNQTILESALLTSTSPDLKYDPQGFARHAIQQIDSLIYDSPTPLPGWAWTCSSQDGLVKAGWNEDFLTSFLYATAYQMFSGASCEITSDNTFKGLIIYTAIYFRLTGKEGSSPI